VGHLFIYLFIPQIGSQIDTQVPHVAWEIDPFGTNFTLDIFKKKSLPSSLKSYLPRKMFCWPCPPRQGYCVSTHYRV